MLHRVSYGVLHRAGFWCLLCVCFWVAGRPALAQLPVNESSDPAWVQGSVEQKIAAIDTGLRSASDRERAMALNAIAQLAVEDAAHAREHFPADSLRPHIFDHHTDVTMTAMQAYLAVSESDAAAETGIVEMFGAGGLPRPWINYARYLRRGGISSDSAKVWLTAFAHGPVSDEKYVAVAALVSPASIRDEALPASLLPPVMGLIRSSLYFCDINLLMALENFEPHAAQHVDELVALRAKLESERGLPVDDRDNKRLFNLGELDGLTRDRTGGSHILEVERDGQLLQFEVPGGHVGILSDIPALRSPR